MNSSQVRSSTLFSRIMWILNIMALLALILSYLAAFISPAKIWWLALFGLSYEIILCINLLFIVYWLIFNRKKALIPSVLVIIGIGKIFGIFQFGSNDKSTEKKDGLKVMTFNVRLFDLYNWFHSTSTRSQIFDFLNKEQPDIICFQEFFSNTRKRPEFSNADTLHDILNAPYSHIVYTLTLRKTDHWGIAIYSKYPIINKVSHPFEERGGNIFIYADIKVNEDTFRVFNTHLESVHFGWSSYHFIENLNNDDVNQSEIAGCLTILRKLKKAFIKRANQVEVLHDSINASPYPVILCGDFNDTPSSYSYAILADDLKDSFRECGSGLGKTYAGPFPSFRINYIFHDKKFSAESYYTHREKLSDHYAVSAILNLRHKN